MVGFGREEERSGPIHLRHLELEMGAGLLE